MTRRCAIYTRKSSDEGLDQEFNSLDAQREAGEAYVKSQASEGWRSSPVRYDDGGYSGGSMDRPGLQRLLRDVEAGLIDVVVVYKIDRLTRSLADFARIVERFDARGVSFVSVTQAFNTTSSMGRLTLNVLLSFAQFEREVTGERIRDKIAASKARGMWMGGTLPLGYDRPKDGSRRLEVNPAEAETVRQIYMRYLALGSAHRLCTELAERGIVSKRQMTANGRWTGGVPFSRGALFHLLRNPLYIGKISHKGVLHDGMHEPIIDADLFAAVSGKLDAQKRRHQDRGESRVAKAPLTGRLFDRHGQPLSPSFSRGKSGRVYRYYVSASLQQGRQASSATTLRVSATRLEKVLASALQRVTGSAVPLRLPRRVVLAPDRIEVTVPITRLRDMRSALEPGEELEQVGPDEAELLLPVRLGMRGSSIEPGAGRIREPEPDRVLIAALRKAHRMLAWQAGRPVIQEAPKSPYERNLLRLALLAPDLQRDILAGRQPAHLNLERLMKSPIPIDWHAQRQLFART